MRSLVVVALVASVVARPAAADNGDRWDPATVGLQFGGGVAGAAVGGIGLGLTGLAIGYAAPGSRRGPALAGGALGLFVGAFAGMVVGVQLSGDARDGTGRWWGTLGGAVVGTGGWIAVVVATRTMRTPADHEVAGFILLSVGLTIVGYHISADDSAPMAVPLTLRF